jgi:DNA-binding MarR family transcriptional regulator
MQNALRTYVQLKRALSHAHAHALRPLGLGPLQAAIIRTLDEEGPCSSARLARATVSDPAAVNRALAGLLAKGLLRRQPHPSDGRSSSLALSPRAGRALADKVAALRLGLERELLAGLPRGDRARFVKDLERIAAYLHALNARRQLNED